MAAQTFDGLAGIRVGAVTTDNPSLSGMYSLADGSDRDDFFDVIYGVHGNTGLTLNREALDFIGNSFDSDSSVITQSWKPREKKPKKRSPR